MSAYTAKNPRPPVPIYVDETTKARLESRMRDAAAEEMMTGEKNGLTTYSGAIEHALDMVDEMVDQARFEARR